MQNASQIVAVNASAYFSRPGPRLIDGLELLAHILHPECVPEAPGEALSVERGILRKATTYFASETNW